MSKFLRFFLEQLCICKREKVEKSKILTFNICMAKNKKDPRKVLADNLVFYRKCAKLTQLDIAEKFNYSDKAVSKWERGESTPDVFVLKDIASFYGITLNDLFKDKPKKYHPSLQKKHFTITLLSILLVWLVATVLFVLFSLVFKGLSWNSDNIWLAYIAALPVSAILGIIFSCLWYTKHHLIFFISVLLWTSILAIYLPLEMYTSLSDLWLLFIIPIPLQVMWIVWYVLTTPLKKTIIGIFKKKEKADS